MTEESKQIVERSEEGADILADSPDIRLYPMAKTMRKAAVHIEKLEIAIDAAERRGFERCREMAANAVMIFNSSFGSEVQHFRSRAIDAIRALQYKDEE